MATPEGKVKARVRRLLEAYGAYYDMPVPGGYGKQSLDFIGCHEGRYFAVETKAPGKTATPRQLLTIANIRRAKGAAFIVAGEETMKVLELWLKQK